jgi:hypothetical protein
MKMVLEARAGLSQDLQLVCKCCGQPYYPMKCWQDQLNAVIEGQEKFAICPICTQTPPPGVFQSVRYRRRCLSEVKRLQKLWEQDQTPKPNMKGKGSLKDLLERLNEAVITGRVAPEQARETVLRFKRTHKT